MSTTVIIYQKSTYHHCMINSQCYFCRSPGFEERRTLLTQRLLEKEKVNLAKYNRTLEDNELIQPSTNSEVD